MQYHIQKTHWEMFKTVLDCFEVRYWKAVSKPWTWSARKSKVNECLINDALYRNASGSLIYIRVYAGPTFVFLYADCQNTLENPLSLLELLEHEIFVILVGCCLLESSMQLQVIIQAALVVYLTQNGLVAGGQIFDSDFGNFVCKRAELWISKNQSVVTTSTAELLY